MYLATFNVCHSDQTFAHALFTHISSEKAEAESSGFLANAPNLILCKGRGGKK